MNILVTGGAGFIASQIVDAYVALGHNVTVVDNLVSGFIENLSPAATFVEMDICDPELKSVFEKGQFDLINHHAAQIDVRKSLENPRFDMNVNIGGALHLLELARTHNVKRVIYASTGGAVHGEPEHLPLKETDLIRPLCHYGISKHTVEHYLDLYFQLYGLNFVVLRYANVYGERQNPFGEAGVNAIFVGKMLQNQVPTIYGDGEQLRDYVYVKDLVRANVLALDHGEQDIFNVATGVGRSVNDIVAVLRDVIGYKGDVIYEDERLGEIKQTYLDPTKIKEQWGWTAENSLEDGLAGTVQWFKEEGLKRFFGA